jgi:hypothetical protein
MVCSGTAVTTLLPLYLRIDLPRVSMNGSWSWRMILIVPLASEGEVLRSRGRAGGKFIARFAAWPTLEIEHVGGACSQASEEKASFCEQKEAKKLY